MPRYCLIIVLLLVTEWAGATITMTILDKSGNQADLSNGVIQLTPLFKTTDLPAPTTTEATITQLNRQFTPYITVIPVGSTVYFPNKDPFAHHVYSFSKPKPFELPLYNQKQIPSMVFDKPGEIIVGCNIHDWMLGYIAVVDAPFYQMIENSQVHFDTLEPGTYQLDIWHPFLHSKENKQRQITITAATQHIDIKLQKALRYLTQPVPPHTDFDEEEDY